MRLWLKKTSWRTFVIALLGCALIASIGFNFVLTHAPSTAHASNQGGRHGVITASPAHPRLTATGSVDWSKLPSGVASHGPVYTGPTRSHDDALTSAQHAAYYQSLKSGAIKAPFVPAPPIATGHTGSAVPGPNFDCSDYSILPCSTYGFNGLNSTDSKNTAINPIQQAIASNTSQVLEGVDRALVLYNYQGGAIYGPTDTTTFFASILHSGDYLGDPQLFWDGTRQRWIFVEVEYDNSVSQPIASYYDIAVSKAQGGSPTPASWYLYQFETNSTALGASTECDAPTLGSDYWGVWLSCVAFSLNNGRFVGNAVFGLSKNALYSGATSVTIDTWYNVPGGYNGSGQPIPALRVSPALEDATPDAEFLVANNQGHGVSSTDLTLGAFTDTALLDHNGTPTFSYSVITLPTSYVDPIQASQPGSNQSIPVDIGPKQVEYIGSNLYVAFTTAYTDAASAIHDGAYWLQVQPQLTPLGGYPPTQMITGGVLHQANIWGFQGYDVYAPSMEASTEDDEVLSYNISANDPFGTAYVGIEFTGRRGSDALNSMGEGSSFRTVVQPSATDVGSIWSEYSACSLAPNLMARGLIWCAAQYAGPHTSPTGPGWDTYVYGMRTE